MKKITISRSSVFWLATVVENGEKSEFLTDFNVRAPAPFVIRVLQQENPGVLVEAEGGEAV